LKHAAAFALATVFGCGYAPVAPGTAGSLAAVGIAWLLDRYCGFRPLDFLWLAAAITIPAMWAADVAARAANKKDPGFVVIDEVAGLWGTLSGAGFAGASHLNWKSWIAAFVLFRLFDIWKPPPVRQLERLPGGIGIVADDLMAGVYGALVLFAAGWFNLY
jgi:phosphatidylglycerophosphatase A